MLTGRSYTTSLGRPCLRESEASAGEFPLVFDGLGVFRGHFYRVIDFPNPRQNCHRTTLEWRRHGIRVADLMPPFVRTPMVAGQAYQPPVLRRLGLRLDAEDIAEAAWRHAHSRRVHRPVGGLFTALYWAGQLSPPWVNRAVMAWLSRDE